jgi:hypothetical protein
MAGSKRDRDRLEYLEIDAIIDDWILDNANIFVNFDVN